MKRAEIALTLALVAVAAATAAAAVKSAFFTRRGVARAEAVEMSDRDWRELAELATVLYDGPVANAAVVFTDFQCPACRALHGRVRALEQQYPGRLRVSIAHYPLSYHRRARDAAVFAECAGVQDAFTAAIDSLYALQQNLDQIEWASLGSRVAGVEPSALLACMNDSSGVAVSRVDGGLGLAERFDVRGTPTIIVNGAQWRTIPSDEDLRRLYEPRQ